MYTVNMEQECECFNKSEYTNNKTFKTQQEAYQYSNIVAEYMNEEFCGRHVFHSELAEDNSFVIRVSRNITFVSGCSTGISCDVGCGSTDDWTLESTDNSANESCATGCGCT